MSAFVPTTSPINDARPTDPRPLTLHREVLLATDAYPAASAPSRGGGACGGVHDAARLHGHPIAADAVDPMGACIAYTPSSRRGCGTPWPISRAAPNPRLVARDRGRCAGAGDRPHRGRVARPRRARLRPHAFFDRLFRDETARSCAMRPCLCSLSRRPHATPATSRGDRPQPRERRGGPGEVSRCSTMAAAHARLRRATG
jgi:hypothetical protein